MDEKEKIRTLDNIEKSAENKLLAIQNASSNIINWFAIASHTEVEELAKEYVENQIYLMYASMDVLSNSDLSGGLVFIEKINTKIKDIERVLINFDQSLSLIEKTMNNHGVEIKLKLSEELEKLQEDYKLAYAKMKDLHNLVSPSPKIEASKPKTSKKPKK